jgi:ribulose-5-phosphate 4-epimerase/fuculose-1-phosphate aldolase
MIKELCDVLEESYKRGWISTRDGNASFRRKNSPYLYITPSGARKNVLRVEDIIKVGVSGDKTILPNGKMPSGELEMHLLLQAGDLTRSVLHVHPTHTIAAMFAGWELSELAAEFPELHRYTRVAKNVPILPVTSTALAKATFHAMTGGTNELVCQHIVGQANHGVCAVARDPWNAFEHVERLEHICEIVIKSGVKPKHYWSP